MPSGVAQERRAVAVPREALGENADPMELIHRYMAPAMDEVGRLSNVKSTLFRDCCSRSAR